MEKKKMGRPTDNPRSKRFTIRMNEDEEKKLIECSKKLKMSKTEVMILGLEEIYKKI